MAFCHGLIFEAKFLKLFFLTKFYFLEVNFKVKIKILILNCKEETYNHGGINSK